MGGGNVPYGRADFGHGKIGFVQQVLRLFTADGVVLPEQGVPGFPLEDAGQIVPVHEKRRGDPGKGELLFAVLPDIVSSLLRKGLACGGSGLFGHDGCLP